MPKTNLHFGVQILDCTLRDGGYLNNWNFGQAEIVGILNSLCLAGVNIIECGFLSKEKPAIGRTVFSQAQNISLVLPKNTAALFVAMVIYGEYDISSLPCAKTSGLFGIRLSFNKNQADAALLAVQELKQKGYAVFLQPVRLSSEYNTAQTRQLVQKVNHAAPFAFYLVDTFGMLDSQKVQELYSLICNNLSPHIAIGYHGHNNRQLALACAKTLVENRQSQRTLFIDSSVMGIGKGAGNLPTEFIMHAMAEDYGAKCYNFAALLKSADILLASNSLPCGWGLHLPYFLSSILACNPSYVSFLQQNGQTNPSAICFALQGLAKNRRQIYNKSTAKNMLLKLLLKL